MNQPYPTRKAAHEAVHRLGSKRNLRHQYDRLFAHSQNFLHRCQVNLRFSRTGDTMNKNRLDASPSLRLSKNALHFQPHRVLVRRQRRRFIRKNFDLSQWVAPDFAFPQEHKTTLVQVAQVRQIAPTFCVYPGDINRSRLADQKTKHSPPAR